MIQHIRRGNRTSFIFALSIGVLLIIHGCKNEVIETDLQKRKTVIVYMPAENSLNSFCYSDLEEILSVRSKIPSNNNVIVYIDKSKTLDIDTLPQLLEISNKEYKTIKVYPEQDSCNDSVFSLVLSDIKSLSPSESYSLVMWSHGTGWIPSRNTPHKTIGIDNNNNSYLNSGTEMEIASMREAIEYTGLHFDCIMFDACFMQCIEVAYELKDITDFVIGSPAEIPAKGAPYNVVIPDFFLTDTETPAYVFAKDYFENYNYNEGVLLSVIKTSELDNLANITSLCFDSIPDVNDADVIQALPLGLQNLCGDQNITIWQVLFTIRLIH